MDLYMKNNKNNVDGYRNSFYYFCE
jgi:hypothetical protein